MMFFLRRLPRLFLLLTVTLLTAAAFPGCTGMAMSAEEYYSLGMAFFDLGKFEDAEKWLSRAKSADKTMTASEYNLGRIAFETKRYNDAARYFEAVLKKDPDNVLALKAAAYTRIKTGELDLAEKHYERLLKLVPESADDGYNHALVLYAMERYDDAEAVLNKYSVALLENNDVILLYARCLNAQGKVEAMDHYAKWLETNTNAKARYEYAQLLEVNELYARSLEEYRKTITEIKDTGSDPKKNELQFAVARVLLIANSDSEEGITELETAISEGYSSIEAVEELQKYANISAANKNKIRNIINNMQRRAEEELAQKQEQEKAKTAIDGETEPVENEFSETDSDGNAE